MTRKQRQKERLGFMFERGKVPRGFFTEAEWSEYERRNEQSFIAKVSRSMVKAYGFGIKKQHRQQRKKRTK